MTARFDHTVDLTAKQRVGGGGLAITWRCMGCNANRPVLGSLGAGLRKRCGTCLAAAVKAVAA